MRPTSESFAAALRSSHRSAARVTVLDPSTFEPLAQLDSVVAGAVAMVRGRAIRRTLDLTLANLDGAWTPTGPGSFLFFGSMLRVERGIHLDAEQVEWFTLGHFLIGRPRAEHAAGESTIAVQGEDRMRLLVRSRFPAPSTWIAGTRLATLIATEAAAAGMGTVRYRLDDGGRTLTRDRTFEEDESRVDALVDLARDYGLELFADADGYLALAEPPDVATAPLAWEFLAGAEAIHLGVAKEWTDDRLYNHVIVTGESADPAFPPVRAEVMDTDPGSPTHVAGPLGDRVYRYTSAMITSTGQATEVAANLLDDVARIDEAIDVPSVVNPALEPGDAVAITDAQTKASGRYLLDEVQTPLVLGEQQLTARVARKLTASGVARRAAGAWWQ